MNWTIYRSSVPIIPRVPLDDGDYQPPASLVDAAGATSNGLTPAQKARSRKGELLADVDPAKHALPLPNELAMAIVEECCRVDVLRLGALLLTSRAWYWLIARDVKGFTRRAKALGAKRKKLNSSWLNTWMTQYIASCRACGKLKTHATRSLFIYTPYWQYEPAGMLLCQACFVQTVTVEQPEQSFYCPRPPWTAPMCRWETVPGHNGIPHRYNEHLSDTEAAHLVHVGKGAQYATYYFGHELEQAIADKRCARAEALEAVVAALDSEDRVDFFRLAGNAADKDNIAQVAWQALIKYDGGEVSYAAVERILHAGRRSAALQAELEDRVRSHADNEAGGDVEALVQLIPACLKQSVYVSRGTGSAATELGSKGKQQPAVESKPWRFALAYQLGPTPDDFVAALRVEREISLRAAVGRQRAEAANEEAKNRPCLGPRCGGCPAAKACVGQFCGNCCASNSELPCSRHKHGGTMRRRAAMPTAVASTPAVAAVTTPSTSVDAGPIDVGALPSGAPVADRLMRATIHAARVIDLDDD